MNKQAPDRFKTTFEHLRKQGRKALVGYLTAGDPDLADSEKQIRIAVREGVDILELGVPFSDPTADGPTIQAAAQRALASGVTVSKILAMVTRLRRDIQTPIVLFGYANPFFHYGYAKLCRDAAQAGADAFLIVDLPFEEQKEILPHCQAHGLCNIPLIAPTTSPARARTILKNAQGFVYYVMVTGVTGKRTHVATDLTRNIRKLRQATQLPIAVGFGVSNGKQAAQAAKQADAVVVGSALVEAARTNRLQKLVREIRKALDA